MKKLILSVIINMTIFQMSLGQNIQWGKEEKLPSKLSFMNGNFVEDKAGIYTTMKQIKIWGKDKFSFQKYDKNCNLVIEEQIDKKYAEGSEGVKILKDNMFFLHSEYKSSTRKTTLFASKINKKTMKMTGKGVTVTTITSRSKRNSGGFVFERSFDKSKLLVVGLDAYVANDKEKFNITVLDENMKKVWQKNITMPYVDKLIGIVSYHVDNQGNVYMLAKKYEDKAKDIRQGKKNYEYLLLSYQNAGNSVEETKIELASDKFIVENAVAINQSGKVVCMGFYSDKGTKSVKGAFVISLNPETKSIENKSVKAFSADFLELFGVKKNKKGEELYNYDLESINFKEDGTITLIAEKFYVTTSTYTDGNGNTRSRTTYHYNHLIVINVDKDAKISWMKKISKIQVASTPYFSSFETFIKNNKVHIIFNDDPKNLDKPINAKKVANFTGKKMTTVLVTIEPDGSAQKVALFKNKDEGVFTVPDACEQINQNQAIIYGQRGKKYKLGKLTF